MIEILTSGAANSVQDLGRFGLLDQGVARAGAMDGLALAAGNLLAGNDETAAGIEVTVFPFRLRCHVPVRLAVTGAVGGARLGDRQLPPWWTVTAAAGDILTLDPPLRGARAYVAFAGGLDCLPLMGSRSTDLKSGFGGHDGRGLRRGDRLAVAGGGGAPAPVDFGLPPPAGWVLPPDDAPMPLRVLPAAEWDEFTAVSRTGFLGSLYRVTAAADRQGCRLEGPALERDAPRELLSHGILPGIVQVPPSGQPIIQTAEANTCGGYPKIATVIEADLWRLGQVAPGSALGFTLCDVGEAVSALRATRAALDRCAAQIALLTP